MPLDHAPSIAFYRVFCVFARFLSLFKIFVFAIEFYLRILLFSFAHRVATNHELRTFSMEIYVKAL